LEIHREDLASFLPGRQRCMEMLVAGRFGFP
jgi:hypothetical protein